MPNDIHNQALAAAFDGQAAKFERAPVQTDPKALERLVRFADLPAGARLLDAGCGPGLVSRAFLDWGDDVQVHGVDLSAEMIERARIRCPERSKFEQGSIYELALPNNFDACVSRYVLHHVQDPAAFIARQVATLRVGGIFVLCDHLADPDPKLAEWHNRIEILRDHTHTASLSAGTIVDLLATAGLEATSLVEEHYTLDFDEWFDRGTPLTSKDEVRQQILNGPRNRGFWGKLQSDGSIEIDCRRVMVRGYKP